jgi:hypothetical protein
MKWVFSILLLLVSSVSFGQGFSYSYVDPCSKKINTVYIPSGQGSVTVSYYGVSNTFTQTDFQNGTFSAWMYSVSAASSQPCEGLKTETQTKTNTIITNNIISTLTSVTAAATMSVTSSISTVSSQSAGTALGNSVNNSSDNSSGGGNTKENKDGQNNSGSKPNNQESGTSGQPQGGGTTTNSSQGTNKTEGGSASGTNQSTEGGNQPSGSPVGGNTAQNQPNTSPNTGKTEPNTGNSGTNTGNSGNTTQSGSNTENSTQSGTNTGQNGGSSTQSGTNTGQNGGSSTQSGTNTGNSGSNTGNSGSNTGNSGSNTGNSGSGGGNTGNSGSNTNNTGGSGGGTDTKTNTTDPTTTPTDTKSGGNGGTTNSVANAAEASSGGSTSNASEGSGGSSKGGAKSNVRVGSIIGTGDIVAIRSAEDNENSFKATMSITKSNTDNSRAKGALLNFTTAINNSNLTFYGAFTNKKKSNTLICANSTMINFNYDLFNTTTVLESHRWNKLSLMGGLNYTIGSMAETSFSNISAVGGGFYMFKASKNLSGNMLLLAVYSPFTKFYEGSWWKSGTLLVPFSSWDYSISKNFKYNVSFSGTWEVGKSVLQYQILTGGKIML